MVKHKLFSRCPQAKECLVLAEVLRNLSAGLISCVEVSGVGVWTSASRHINLKFRLLGHFYVEDVDASRVVS